MRQLTVYQQTPFDKITRLISLYVVTPVLLALMLPVLVNIATRAEFGFSVHNLVVVSVTSQGPAARSGLRPHDRIVAVGDTPVTRMHQFYAARAGNRSLQPLALTVRDPQGQIRHLSIQPARPSQGDLIHSYSLWVVGLSFLLIGWWVLRGRTDPVARNFFWLCLVFALLLADIPDHRNMAYMLAKDSVRSLLQLLLPAFFLRFFLQFPASRHRFHPRDTRYRLLLAPGWLLFLLIVGLDVAHITRTGDRIESFLEITATIYALSYFVAGLVIFARQVLRRDRPIQQTKLRLVLVGLVCGLVPFLAAMVVGNFVPGTPLPHWQYLSLSVLLVPISFGLAIMRYGALDKGFVVRVSLVYGLVTLLVLLGYFLIVGLLGSTLASLFEAEAWPLLVLIAAVSGLVILPLRNIIQVWLDNTFYPARRADRRAIIRLAEELTGIIEPDAVVQAIQANLQQLYRPDSFTLFLPAASPGAGFRAEPAGPRPTPDSETMFLPATSGLAHLLDQLRRPVHREEIEDSLFAGEADAASLELLTHLNIALVVPLITGGRLVGFMAFGPKQGGELFSQDDLANLRALAVQAASLVESRQMYQASLGRKRLETELEVARDIQANLLPDAALQTPNFTIIGRNEPCRMVGGDYFDYFVRGNDELCFAIADVSGKGIPAALMMTSVRVAFRQVAQAGLSPVDQITRLNEVVCALGSLDRFICFFCGVWSPATGLLRYCNAGMEPPVLFRARQSYRQTLRKGGPVLGVQPEAHYREGALSLETGDCIFLYTDGLTEERNAQGEFFDAPRLHDLVARHLADPPDALLGKVFAQVNAFGGDERSDDRTAIIMDINILQN